MNLENFNGCKCKKYKRSYRELFLLLYLCFLKYFIYVVILILKKKTERLSVILGKIKEGILKS